VRGGLVSGTKDSAPFYTANGTSSNGLSNSDGIDATSDGRYIVFSSTSKTLDPANPKTGTKIFRYDTQTGTNQVVSLSTTGTLPAGCISTNPSISSDGTKIVFESKSCNLGYGSSTTIRQIYLRDLTAGTTVLVSHAAAGIATRASGDCYNPKISADGNFAVYTSDSTGKNIVNARPAGRTEPEIYRYSVAANTNAQAVFTSSGGWTNNPSNAGGNQHPSISSDGTYVAYDSDATGLAAGGSSRTIYVTTFGATPSTTRLGIKIGGGRITDVNSSCTQPSISEDASAITYLCALASGDQVVTSPSTTALQIHVYYRKLASASTLVMVDKSPAGAEGDDDSDHGPSISKDGAIVGFATGASNLLRTTDCSPACQSTGGTIQAYMFDAASADPDLKRAFVVSQVRSSGATPYAIASGGITAPSGGHMVKVIGVRDGAALAYVAPGGSFTPLSSGDNQVFVSPISDSLSQ